MKTIKDLKRLMNNNELFSSDRLLDEGFKKLLNEWIDKGPTHAVQFDVEIKVLGPSEDDSRPRKNLSDTSQDFQNWFKQMFEIEEENESAK